MSSDTLLSRTLGQYEITERLGRGGMATVYRARQENMQRDVAIKVMAVEMADNPQFVARFEREAQVLASLEHPHVLPVHDFGHEGDLFYLVMRLVEGDTLYQRLLKGHLSLDKVNRLLTQIAEALDYAHAKGVIHRDLKPTNVLLDEWDNAYLMDFGLAKLMSSSQQLTASGTVLGTPAYMAPEQWRGETIDKRTDVYALGVILYEMVVGAPPFEAADTPFTLMYKHINDAPPAPRTILPDLPEQVERVIFKALAKSPEFRFQSAGELARALKAARHSEVAVKDDDPALQRLVSAEAKTEVEIKPAAVPAPIVKTEQPVPPPPSLAPPPSPVSPASQAPLPQVRSIPLPGRVETPPEVEVEPVTGVPDRRPDSRPDPLEHVPPGMRSLVERVRSSETLRQALDAVEGSLEAVVEKAAEAVPAVRPPSDPNLIPDARMAAAPIYDHMRGLLEPGEVLVGVLDVRGTTSWKRWKDIIVGAFVLLIIGSILNVPLLGTLGVLGFLYIGAQSFRTWKGYIGRYYLGFSPRRVIVLPRTPTGTLHMGQVQAAAWTQIDRLRVTNRYVLLDVKGNDAVHLGALVVEVGEGGLGDQSAWLKTSPVKPLVLDRGFEARDN